MNIVKVIIVLLLIFTNITFAFAKDKDDSVVIIVDTSVSMTDIGMDPQRVSLLVSKLLSDVIPGNLSYVKLLDLGTDSLLLPSKKTGRKIPCGENINNRCFEVKHIGNWTEMAHDKEYGLLERPSKGDNKFKIALEKHLAQVSNNSAFYLAFSSARGWLNKNTTSAKYIVWLSDGKTDNEQALLEQINKAKADNIHIEAIVFGGGDTSLAKKALVPVIQTQNPADLMKAFADVFRKIVHAPYDIDNTIATNPSFKILSNMKEAWVVVYGDDSLIDVSLIKPDGSKISADYASDRWSSAGAYKVAFLKNPQKGNWKVKVKGGGKDVAYAVVQNSSLYPFLEKPNKTSLGVKTSLIASIKVGGTNDVVNNRKLLGKSKVTAVIDTKEYLLNDNGIDGDKQARDGLFSGMVTFNKEGKNEVKLRLFNEFTDKTKRYFVNSIGSFSYTNSTIPEINFGSLAHNSVVCKEIFLNAKQQGLFEFEYKILDSLPAEHQLIASTLSNQTKLMLKPKEIFKVCLQTGKRAPSSKIKQQELLLIKLAKSTAINQQVIYKVSWDVKGLSFLECWWWLLLIITSLILLTIIILGYVLPQRFQSTLHIAMGADMEELDEFIPMQLKRMPKVGIGFYRNAQAFIHDDFRVTGKGKGASVRVKAEKSEIIISAVSGRVIQHVNMQQEWEKIDEDQSLRTGEVLRIRDTGLYFKLLDM